LKSKRTVFLTLGTGFGSAFMVDGNLVKNHPEVPENGVFYDKSFLGTIADECFSTRWIDRKSVV